MEPERPGTDRHGATVAHRAADRLLPTWHARSGRLGASKRDALEHLLPPLLPGPLAERAEDATLALELGAGTGEAALALAEARPDLLVVAAEVHRSSLATLVLRAVDGPPNIRVWPGDGRLLVADAPSASVRLVRIFFPDPWPKTRHHDRRLVEAGFASLLADRLGPGARVELATDHEPYARQMRRILDATAGLRGGPTDRADRPVTHYEQRACDAGRAVTDLCYERVTVPGGGDRAD